MNISLALGGGGSRGYAHIGVIRRLEEEGFRIRAVAGTSAGGVIAAFYASGYTPDQMEDVFDKMDQSKLFARTGKDGPSILGRSGVTRLLEEYLGERTFADLKIPCAMAAVDIKSAREVALIEGRLVDAIQATIAVPAILPPQQVGEARLVDGAGMNPVPVSLARLLAPRLPVVAVSLTPRVGQDGALVPMRLPALVPTPIADGFSRMRLGQALDVYIHAADATDRMLTELRLRLDHPEVIIRPDVSWIQMMDRVDICKVVRLGERAAGAAIPELRRVFSWPNRLRRRLFSRNRMYPIK